MGSGVTQATTDAWDWENPLDPDDANALPMDALSLFWRDVAADSAATYLLGTEEERDLMRRARLGDKAARQSLVTHNLRLVGHMARRFATSYQIPLADALQEGTIGLIRAASKCDERKQTTFSTYAWFWIRQAMQRARVDQRASHLKLPIREVDWATRHYHATGENLAYDLSFASLDKPLKFRQNGRGEDNEDSTLQALLPDTADDLDEAETRIDNYDIPALLAHVLTPREARVVTLHLGLAGGEGLTLEVIGKRLERPISRERVRQIYAGALRKLRLVAPDLWPEHAGRTVVRATPKPAPRRPMRLQKAG